MTSPRGSAVPDAARQLASLPLAIVLLAPELRIAAANPAAEQFFSQSARRLVGMELKDILAFSEPRLAERLRDTDTPVSAHGAGVVVQGRGVRRVDLTVTPVIDEPGWQLLTLHDNTTSGALGEDSVGSERAALRGQEILAHEIKNPLAGIRGAAQLLARKVDDRERALTDLIAGEVDRIATLIDQMQRLSRRTSAPVEPCNLHEAIRRAVAVIEAGGFGSRIVEEFDPSLPMALGSSDALVQVLINLLSNAREACGGVDDPRIVVRTRFASGLQLHSSETGKPVRLPAEIRVSDNGPGVDPELREHIFEPFVTSKKTGQGLGLALVRKLVRDMNGRISHERDEEHGLTHFRIHLPLAEQPAARKPARKGRA